MQILFDHFNKIVPITEKEINEVTPFLKTKTLEKDEILLNIDQTCDVLTFVKRGSFRTFHIHANGDSMILALTSENEWISNYESYLSGSPSDVIIQSIGKSEIIFIHKKNLSPLLENSLYWNKVGRIMTEQIFLLAKKRLETLLYKTPEERYLEIITHYPEFLDKFSLTDISSFIGIKPQSLSRIRARF